jgi:tetratricopeptide (TPR) repeat protein
MPARGAHPSFMTNGNSQVTGASLQRGYFPGDGHDTRPLKPAELGSVAKLPFRGKIQKSSMGKSMACESKLSCFRYFATEPVAIRVNNLGRVLHDLGDLAGARAAFECALAIHEASSGPDHPDVATTVNNLGGVLHDLGDLAGARAAYERALRIMTSHLGEGHPSTQTVRGNLDALDADM